MKNKIILLLILFLTSNSNVFAIQEGNVISDSVSVQKKYIESFDDVTQYTNNFFTPSVKKYVDPNAVIDEKEIYNGINPQTHGSLPPVKRLRLRLKAEKYAKAHPKSKTQAVQITEAPDKDQAILDCETMEYFAPRTELEANGHVVVFFPQNNSTLKADKMIYNQTSNVINAYGKVVLISDGKELFGDYMHIDMNEENALMDQPVTEFFQIHAHAKKGYMYGDKIIQEQGNLLVTKHTMINIKSEMFGPDLDAMFVDQKDKSYFMKDSHGEKFKIKTNDLIINSKKEHDTVTLKHADLYFNEKKIGTIPSITMHTNKNQDFVEADFPEFGTFTNMGMYAGPGFVFDTPKGTTLKVVPLLNYQSNGDNTEDNKMGFGGIVKYKSASNKTDFAYGTANKILVTRGLQKLDDDLYFQYSSNAYIDDWFMGFRMPKLLGELVYQKENRLKGFLGPERQMTFTNRLSGAYAQDGDFTSGLLDNDGYTGTIRVKYMNEAVQNLWGFSNPYKSPINGSLDLVGETSSAVYGAGGTQFIGRIGPRLHTQYKYWMQDVGYFLSASDDKTSFQFDRYMYGRSNAYLRENFRLCKYLTASWFTSLNLSQDSWDGKMLQENSFFFAIGPDDVKLNIGYDTVRQQSFVTMSMHLDAKGTNLEYNKMIIKNPDTLGKDPKKKDQDQGSASPAPAFLSTGESDVSNIEKAEVVNVEEAL